MIGWVQRRLERREDGFALVFVLLITTVVTLAVATSLAVTAPNIVRAKNDQNQQAAFAAAQAGVDAFVAYLDGQANCRSTSRICNEALGASSGSTPTAIAGTNETYSWNSDAAVTSDYFVRVHSLGRAGSATRKIVADLALSRGILSFGYYTDYESQSPSFLSDYYAARHIYLSNSSTYSMVNARDTSNRTISVGSPTTAYWYGSPTSGTNPYPASICGWHWYASNGNAGRYTLGSQSVWGENGKINSSSLIRSSSCDVVFTTGMTFDGPVYTRDAMLISDATVGGVGPIFKQPVLTLWGYRGGAANYSTPDWDAGTPWREDPNVGGTIHSPSPSAYAPQTSTFDLQLPTNIGSNGLPSNACVYYGPTRVKLNGDGTATVTSPYTTARATGSDAACYPTGSLAGGIVQFTVNYATIGNGAIYVQNLLPNNDPVPSDWPANPTQSTVAATSSNSVMWVPSSAGGATVPDQTDGSAATDTCSSTSYAATASWPCAWTGVGTATDGVGVSSPGWLTYTKTTCGSALATNRELFECEYGHQASTAQPTVNQSAGNYASLRTAAQTAMASCTPAAGAACLTTKLNSALQTANSSQRAANATGANGDHQYVVTATSTGTSSQGTARNVGSAPTPPMSSDAMFASQSAPAQEAATKTPITLNVSRQTWGCFKSNGSFIGDTITNIVNCLLLNGSRSGWGGNVAQFSLTATGSHWAITAPASATSYFPDTADVSRYNGTVAGAGGTDRPGDLYVEGNNQGRISLLAQNDVVVTGDIVDTSANAANDAVDLVAGGNVRNYHPVQCVDQTAADINATTPGWCPNDLTGLYRGATGMENNGVLTSAHPAMQYTNMTLSGQPSSCPTTTPGSRRIDAAVFSLSGSFLTDNYNRGCALGNLTVNGGLYQSHRGANGVQWEYQTGDTKRATSGYSLQFHYVDLQHASLPYTPPVTGDGTGHIWTVASISSDGT